MDRWIEFNLKDAERPRRMYVYWVTGRGVFPFDMLRYDQAWPASGDDAARLEWEQMREGVNGSRKIRSIKLHSYKEPTIGRWSSFLWSVGNEKLDIGEASGSSPDDLERADDEAGQPSG